MNTAADILIEQRFPRRLAAVDSILRDKTAARNFVGALPDLTDLLALAFDHPAIRKEMLAVGVTVPRSSVAFAARDLPLNVAAAVDDIVRDME